MITKNTDTTRRYIEKRCINLTSIRKGTDLGRKGNRTCDHSIIHENVILGTERVLNMNYSNKKAKKDRKNL